VNRDPFAGALDEPSARIFEGRKRPEVGKGGLGKDPEGVNQLLELVS